MKNILTALALFTSSICSAEFSEDPLKAAAQKIIATYPDQKSLEDEYGPGIAAFLNEIPQQKASGKELETQVLENIEHILFSLIKFDVHPRFANALLANDFSHYTQAIQGIKKPKNKDHAELIKKLPTYYKSLQETLLKLDAAIEPLKKEYLSHIKKLGDLNVLDTTTPAFSLEKRIFGGFAPTIDPVYFSYSFLPHSDQAHKGVSALPDAKRAAKMLNGMAFIVEQLYGVINKEKAMQASHELKQLALLVKKAAEKQNDKELARQVQALYQLAHPFYEQTYKELSAPNKK